MNRKGGLEYVSPNPAYTLCSLNLYQPLCIAQILNLVVFHIQTIVLKGVASSTHSCQPGTYKEWISFVPLEASLVSFKSIHLPSPKLAPLCSYRVHIPVMSASEEMPLAKNSRLQTDEAQNVAMPGEHFSHSMSSSDPGNPMNWPIHRRIYASSVAWFFAFAV